MLFFKICRFIYILVLLSTPPGIALAQTSLPALIQSALLHHPAIRAQGGSQEAAQAGVAAARWQYWPTPSVGIEQVGTNDPTYSGDKRVTTLRLQQTLWAGGRLDGNLSKAQAQAIAAQADVEATRQQIALRLIQSWSDAIAAQGKVLAYEQSRSIHARLLTLVERRTQNGATAQADIDLARSRLDGTDAELATVLAQRESALDKLRLLVGQPIAVTAIAAAQPHLEQTLTRDALLTAAHEHSPQIAKSRAQVKVAEAEIDLAKATLTPEVYLRAERQYGNFQPNNQNIQDRVFVGVSTAFGAGLSSLSGLDAARARHRAAQDDVQTQHLALDEQILNDIILSRTAGQRRSYLELVRHSAADVYASWERQFLAGRKQWQDLMNAAREQTQNDAQLADAIATQQLTGWRLHLLTQGLDAVLQAPTRAISAP